LGYNYQLRRAVSGDFELHSNFWLDDQFLGNVSDSDESDKSKDA
jgi:hypothetical protein